MLLYIHRKFKGVHSIHETNLHLYSFVHKNTNLHKYMYYYVLLIKKSFQNYAIFPSKLSTFSLSLFIKYIFQIPLNNPLQNSFLRVTYYILPMISFNSILFYSILLQTASNNSFKRRMLKCKDTLILIFLQKEKKIFSKIHRKYQR